MCCIKVETLNTFVLKFLFFSTKIAERVHKHTYSFLHCVCNAQPECMHPAISQAVLLADVQTVSGQRAEPCNLNGICQSNNTCFCENDFATCAPLDTTNGCETNIGNDTNKCALPAARPACELFCRALALPFGHLVVWQRLSDIKEQHGENSGKQRFYHIPKISWIPNHAPEVFQSLPVADLVVFTVSDIRSTCISCSWCAQLRVLRVPVPDCQRRVLQRRVRGPADQLHQLRPVRLLLRQPAQHPGVQP